MRMTLIVGISLCLALTACSNGAGDTKDLQRYSGRVHVQSKGQSTDDLTLGRHIVPIREMQNSRYVSVGLLTEAIGFQGAWLSDGSYGVGDYDAAWVFQTGNREVSVAEEKRTIEAPAIKEGNELFIPVSAIQTLFGDITTFTEETSNVAFFPRPVAEETGASGSDLDFADDPSEKPASIQIDPIFPVLANSDSENLISYAKKFRGVDYEFGAGSYKQNRTFDCSSYTRYVYDTQGVNLPRLARQQARKGNTVSRKKLRRGDLMFFYVPGRFKSNKVVGHVGIYMGWGNMIHSSPKPKDGVQITPINKPYWKRTFLYAKRVS